jgi:hypothetical protein
MGEKDAKKRKKKENQKDAANSKTILPKITKIPKQKKKIHSLLNENVERNFPNPVNAVGATPSHVRAC